MQINVDVVNPSEHRLPNVDVTSDDHMELAGPPRASRVVAAHGFIKAPEILALLNQLNADAVVDSLTGADRLDFPASGLVRPLKRDRYERRIARRMLRSALRPDVRLTMRGVSRAEIVNISETGVLVEMSARAVIGSVTELVISTDHFSHTVPAKTVRSSVAAIESGSVVYRAAFHFDEPLPLGHLLRN